MATDNSETVLRELRDRIIRLESRMVQLGDHVGANLRMKQRIHICPSDPDHPVPWVDVDALDVSASRILTELRQGGLRRARVDVWCQGRCVFTLYPDIEAQ